MAIPNPPYDLVKILVDIMRTDPHKKLKNAIIHIFPVLNMVVEITLLIMLTNEVIISKTIMDVIPWNWDPNKPAMGFLNKMTNMVIGKA